MGGRGIVLLQTRHGPDSEEKKSDSNKKRMGKQIMFANLGGRQKANGSSGKPKRPEQEPDKKKRRTST